MKKFFILFACMFCFNAIYSQDDLVTDEWVTKEIKADDFKNIKHGIQYFYSSLEEKDQEFGFVFKVNDKNKIEHAVIQTGIDFFDYNYKNEMTGTIGYYDNNDNLIKKERGVFFVPTSKSNCATFYYKWQNSVCKYLMNEQGYIRLVMDRYKESDLDIKIPCINNKN